MADISIAVSLIDDPVAKRTLGDIAAVRPGGWQWGSAEVKLFLIVDLPLPPSVTFEEAQQQLESAYFANGVLTYEGEEPVDRRRFKVDIDLLKGVLTGANIAVDWAKVYDKTVAYQPLSVQTAEGATGKATRLDVTKFVQDKYAGRLIKSADFKENII